MTTGVVLLNFGEPEQPTEAEVLPFLERIFAANASLEAGASPEDVARRSRELAERRTPGLIADYERIGGSPLNRQAAAQAEALREQLVLRGHDARVYVAMQFTEPGVARAIERARADGVEHLVALPVYPLCGASTTLASLDLVSRALESAGWAVPLSSVSGWHLHPLYTAMRADGIVRTAAAAGIALDGKDAKLVFSAHGTPVKYLRQGSRYDLYVEDSCRRIAEAANAPAWVIGYQNHSNRNVEWTQPEIASVLRDLDAGAVVVDAVSFMHEQSETLGEIDIELREVAERAGLAFHRVPVPHADPRFPDILADLVEARLGSASAVPLVRCRCHPDTRTRCTNATLERG